MKIKLFLTKFLKIKLNFIIILIFFSTQNNYSNADIEFAKNLPKKIYIKQSPQESKKFVKNLFRAFTDGDTEKKKNIRKKYKKWFNANLHLSNEKEMKIKIRLMGDWKDHLKPPISSLKVKIVDDNNLSGFRRFKIYLPNTRNGNNEIFFTTILRYLDFPSYYTSNVEVNLNGKTFSALLQEDASKEFLERNKIPELPIIKADEFNFYLDDKSSIYKKKQKIRDSYIVYNQNFLKKNQSNKIISDAINLAHSKNFKKLIYNNNFFEDLLKKYAQHGFAGHNRKYIYIPFSKTFIPLYYDGNVNFPVLGSINCKIPNNLSKIMDEFKKEYFILAKKKISKKMKCAAIDIFTSHKKFKKKNKFFLHDKNEYDFNLQFSKDYKELATKIRFHIDNNKIHSDINEIKKYYLGYSYTLLYKKKYYKCFLDFEIYEIKACIKLTNDEYRKNISTSQKVEKSKNNIKIANINLGAIDFDHNLVILKYPNDNNEFLLENDKIYYLLIGKNNGLLTTVSFKNPEARLIISGDLSHQKFILKNDIKRGDLELSAGNDKNYLNGCTTILSSKFDKVDIYANDFHCEDSLNIINSSGEISNLEVTNSSFDAVDFDFSNIDITNIIVKNSKNDCLDLSFGTYSITQGQLISCNDKGISLGETSKGIFNNVIISKSKLGIVAKDESKAYIENLIATEIEEYCLSAYKKKQEFGGGKIFYQNINCDKGFYFDQYSAIVKKK